MKPHATDVCIRCGMTYSEVIRNRNRFAATRPGDRALTWPHRAGDVSTVIVECELNDAHWKAHRWDHRG